jgi:hypothetical protein
LIARAKTVVPHLIDALPAASDTQRRGMFDVLEELLLANDPEITEDAESALERLAVGDDRELADDAERLLSQNATLRHGRAIAMFTELGGLMENAATLASRDSASWSSRHLTATPQPLAVVDSHWRGGDQGLKYLTRMFPSEMLSVHITHDAPVSTKGITRMRESSRGLLVRREFEGCLGIVVDSRSTTRQVTINSVISGSPADQAGMQAGDAILSIEGTPIEVYEDLGRLTTIHQPGDYLRVRLRRNGQTIRLRMALGTDFRTGRCRCVEG